MIGSKSGVCPTCLCSWCQPTQAKVCSSEVQYTFSIGKSFDAIALVQMEAIRLPEKSWPASSMVRQFEAALKISAGASGKVPGVAEGRGSLKSFSSRHFRKILFFRLALISPRSSSARLSCSYLFMASTASIRSSASAYFFSPRSCSDSRI